MERLTLKKHSLIFGGNSTIGNWISRSLEKHDIQYKLISRLKVADHSIKTDLTNYNNIIAAYNLIFKEIDKIDSIYYCAGSANNSELNSSNPEEWLNDINVNLIGAYYAYRGYFEAGRNIDNTKFIYLGSTASISRPKDLSSYSISKLALEQLVNYINNEKPISVRACCLRLGTCQTKFSGAQQIESTINSYDMDLIITMLESSRIDTFPDLISSRPIKA